MPQSKNTLLKEHIASAKKTSMKGTGLGLPKRQELLGISNAPALCTLLDVYFYN